MSTLGLSTSLVDVSPFVDSTVDMMLVLDRPWCTLCRCCDHNYSRFIVVLSYQFYCSLAIWIYDLRSRLFKGGNTTVRNQLDGLDIAIYGDI